MRMAEETTLQVALARKAERQNKAILIFTIVTVVFLPLSFFTSYFGKLTYRRVLKPYQPESRNEHERCPRDARHAELLLGHRRATLFLHRRPCHDLRFPRRASPHLLGAPIRL